MNIPTPYLVFLGDAKDYKQAKVAHGVVEWRPELCSGQSSLDGCEVNLGLPNLTLEEARDAGVKTLLIGISPYSTTLPDSYREYIIQAMDLGLNVASPLHAPLDAQLEQVAAMNGVQIFNFRHRSIDYPKGSGNKRPGLRLLTVGTDCACGKKFTALSIDRALRDVNVKSTFRATGQTGFLISQSGINNDTIQADFLSGAAEWLTPANDVDHWDVVEGQGALSHPSFGAGSLSLIYGTQPDFIVMCTEPGRKTQRGVTRAPLPIMEEVRYVEAVAERTNPAAEVRAFSLFTRDAAIEDIVETIRQIRLEQPYAFIFDPHVAATRGTDVVPELDSVRDFYRFIEVMRNRAHAERDLEKA